LKYAALVVLGVLGCSAHSTAPADAARPAAVAAAGPTLAIYMPGANLEDSALVRGSWQPDEEVFLPKGQRSRWGAASDDLRELVAAAGALRVAEAQRPSVWVAFGGARKVGWHGVRYADLRCLTLDAADELFGDAGCYAFTDEQADMSQPATLSRFLGFVKTRLGAGPNVLVLWGQGGAHEGMFYDTVHQELPFMRLPQLREAFTTAGARFDVLGFDAGMMANLEALEVVRPFATLLVASPDRAPSHGWDYRALLGRLAAGAAAPALARGIADDFMTGHSLGRDAAGKSLEVNHASTRAKSIAVFDAAKLAVVGERLDALATAAVKIRPRLTASFLLAAPIGRDRQSDTVEAVDLAGVARVTAAVTFALASPANALARSIDAAVIYARSDHTAPSGGRLSVFSPIAEKLWRATYQEGAFLSPAWRDYLAHEETADQADARPPAIKARGRRAVVTDDHRVARVEVLRIESTGKDLWRVWQSSEATLEAAAPDLRSQTVSFGAWDGQALWLGNGPGGAQIPVPTHVEGKLAGGHLLLSAAALVRDARRKTDGEDATLYVELAGDTVADAWIAPLELDTEGRVLFSREQYRLDAGLSVAFYALGRQDPTLPPGFTHGDFFDLTAPPVWKRAPLGKKKVTSLLAAVDGHHHWTFVPVKP
jgi:hypothetical protein